MSVENAPITVLHSLAPPDGTTRYVDQMTEGAPADVEVRYFSWRFALTGRYDVLHLHWPEFLVRARRRRTRLAKRLAMRALLWRARRARIPIVRTTHNITPHESGTAAEARLVRAVDRSTTAFIHLNGTTAAPAPGLETVIAHGHYRDRFAAHPRAERVPGRIVYFGIIRPRKNVERLIDVFLARERPGCHLRIVGSPTPELAERITARITGRPDVSARLAFVDDDELVAEVTAASLVVLPYAEMHNSGAALVALSLDRPVLVPRSPANDELGREVGSGWVLPFDGSLDDADLSAAMAAAEGIDPDDRPELGGRDWDEVGRRHRDVYRAALDRVRGGSR
ncbi:glycosyltransferase [Microbacterium sp. NPDC090007]|uniref:glycosyltransferase n=1 Tax=Microbacterium sp. NPDC090007 TaxID=3364204 RepID=UPI00381BF721